MAKNCVHEYLSITEIPRSGKTNLYEVSSRGQKVGVIKWYGGWRKYIYYTEPDTYYDSDGMRMISEFMFALNKAYYGI